MAEQNQRKPKSQPAKGGRKHEPRPARVTPRPSSSEEAVGDLWNNLFGNGESVPAEGEAQRDQAGVWRDVARIEDNPYQPRQRISQRRLKRTINSLNHIGQLQAALGRPHPKRKGWIQLAAGHRRKAAVKAGANAGSYLPEPHNYIGKLRVEIRDLSDAEMLDAAFDENEEREDFSLFDIAHYYVSLRLLNSPSAEDLISWEDLVARRRQAGRPLPLQARSIRRIVDVLRLPEEIQNSLADLNLAATSEAEEEEEKFQPAREKHARALLLLQPAEQRDPKVKPNPEQAELLRQIIEERLSANETLRRAEAVRDAQELADDHATSSAGAGGASGGAPSVGGSADAGTSSAPAASGADADSRTTSDGGAGDSSGAGSQSAQSADPILMLNAAQNQLEKLRRGMVEGNVRTVPPSEIERSCKSIEQLLAEIRKLRSKRRGGESKA